MAQELTGSIEATYITT